MPYILFKDSCNRKSNQKNLGTIRCSNLCTEIIEYTAPDEIAVCNLASLVLPKFVKFVSQQDATTHQIPMKSQNKIYHGLKYTESEQSGQDGDLGVGYMYDHDQLYEIVKIVTRNLNKIIDINYYPVPEARKSNMRHRPIGIGVQGLADVFQLMRLPFDCEEARRLNHDIFETIYYAALECSCELAEKHGYYESYPGSPASEGLLQFDLWKTDHNHNHQESAAEGSSKTTYVRIIYNIIYCFEHMFISSIILIFDMNIIIDYYSLQLPYIFNIFISIYTLSEF